MTCQKPPSPARSFFIDPRFLTIVVIGTPENVHTYHTYRKGIAVLCPPAANRNGNPITLGPNRSRSHLTSRSFTLEDQSFTLESQSFAVESRSFTLEDQSFVVESQSFVVKDRSFTVEDQSFTLEDQSFTLEDQSFTLEDQSFVREPKTVGVEDRSISWHFSQIPDFSEKVGDLNHPKPLNPSHHSFCAKPIPHRFVSPLLHEIRQVA